MSQDSSSDDNINLYDEYLDLGHEYADLIRLTVPEAYYQAHIAEVSQYEGIDTARHELNDSGLPSLSTYDMYMAMQAISPKGYDILNAIMEGLQFAIFSGQADAVAVIKPLLAELLVQQQVSGSWAAQRFAEKYVSAYERARDEIYEENTISFPAQSDQPISLGKH